MIEMDEFDISNLEKDAIYELRTKFSKELDQKVYDDTFLFYRFLKAQDFNVQLAESMLRKALNWRKQLQVDTILTDYDPPEVVRKYFANTRFAFDKKGQAVHYLPLGKMDSKGILMSSKYSDLEKTFAQIIEKDELILSKKRKTLGGLYPGYIYIYDMDGLDFANATDKKGIETSIRILKIYINYYAERATALYIINASSFFYIPFAIVKPFVDSKLLSLVHIFGNDGWKDEFLKIIDADELPVFLGGNRTDPDGNPLCKTIVNQGGKIDESFYLQKSKKSLINIPGIQKLVLSRASFSEIFLEAKEAGSLIEWEFETKTRDVGFGLFFKETVNDEESITELVPLLRLDTEQYAETGMYKCERAGTYVMLFDNSYSWIRSKEIYYRTNIISPKDHEEQMQ